MATAIKAKMKLNSFQKQKYEKPAMKVVLLQQRSMLLAGSLGDPSDYPGGGDPLNF